jgi:high-affinity iron transporter
MAHLPSFRPVLLLLLLAVAPSFGVAAADRTADTRRLLTLLAGVASEYREAFDDQGRLVRTIEIEEARLLLAEARDLNARLGAVEPARLDALGGDLDDHGAPVRAFEERVRTIAATISERTGVRDDPLPPAPPSAARGKALYAENCVGCHGIAGDGGGEEAKRLGLTPASFTSDAFMRGETPRDFFNVISLGRRRSGMPEWGEALSVQQRWDTVAYLWTLSHPRAALAEGQGLYLVHCAGCHGTDGAGDGPRAARLLTPVPDLTGSARLTDESDARLMDVVTEGVPGTAMPGFASLLTDDQRWKVVAWQRMLSLGGLGESAPEPSPPAAASAPEVALAAQTSAAVAESHRLLDAAIAARRLGAADASAIATDAYMRFEPVEKRLGAIDRDAVARVEEGFVRVRSALREPGVTVSPALEAEVARLHGHLDAAAAVPATSGGDWARFAQSAGIILREGFEVVLIVGALLTYVRRSGQSALVRPLWTGSTLGVLASLVTAVLLSTVFRLHPAASEALEGAAMLLAALVLFWVSYWLISKAEAERWQRYIQGKVKQAVAAGSATALAAAAFLAVYREGFETVLFYQALVGGAPAGDVMIGAGFLCGLAVLAGVWVAMSWLGLRVPIRPFFLLTGAFLYAMAIVFAGRGVFELQDSGFIGLTPVAVVPRIPVLGVFPTVETLLAQGVLVGALFVAAIVSWRRSRSEQLPRAELASGGGRA